MSSTVNRYQIYCQTEATWVTAWGTSPITTCPNNTAHTVTAGSVSIIDTISENTVSYRNSTLLDSYGKIRVANNRTLLSFEQIYDTTANIKFDTLVSGSGTRTYNPDDSSSTLTCTTNAADSVIFQTREYIVYQSGTSTLILFTGIIGEQKTNCDKYIGYLDNENGLFFAMKGDTGMNVGYRSKASGVIVENLIPKNSWNGDKMDGTGPSGIIIDFTKIQLWYLDFQWQGSGRVRWGFYYNGRAIIVHSIDFANTLTSPYLSSPNLPVRYEIRNTGTTASNTTMKAICVGVNLESTTDPSGFTFSQSSSLGPTPLLNVLTPIISIRLKTNFRGKVNRMKVVANRFSLFSSNANNIYSYSLIWNPTLTGAVWTDVNTANSGIEYDQTALTATGGITMSTGFFNSANNVSEIHQSSYLDYNNFPLGLNINGNSSIILTLAVTRINGNGSVVFGGLDWEEIY